MALEGMFKILSLELAPVLVIQADNNGLKKKKKISKKGYEFTRGSTVKTSMVSASSVDRNFEIS
jgi:hypothetical protein